MAMSTQLGNLFIVAAPSGAGKSSLIKALLESPEAVQSPMQVSVSLTTRAPRPGEVNGQHYHFVSKAEFEAAIERNELFEWAEVFGNYYGTSRVVIEETLQQGIDVFLDIDWQGARQVKALLPDTTSIFILPPSLTELEARLQGRGQDSAEVIAKRMQQASSEISHHAEFDFLVVNDDFNTALHELRSIVHCQRLTRGKQSIRHAALLATFVER